MTDMRMVPLEPTREMTRAGMGTMLGVNIPYPATIVANVYKAMLAAAPHSDLPALERELAEESAISGIHSFGTRAGPDELWWEWNGQEDEKPDWDESIRYLELRGMLERHDKVVGGGNPDWVRIRDE